ncbi:hypothetical protein KC19_VG120000 [Ceratodon purpureus]|uniref:COMM domain-containing protein n=1 Tax=Ceratodon purpureus TaxID=3225 RepID=A0A8T0HPF5_CERPU|nr:hypothetical protein KC19_VG120000 [Ceratodon purpureus]
MFAQRHQELFGIVALCGTSYGRLDWRLDIQVVSRSVGQQAIPRFLLALQTTDGLKHLEADYTVLKDVCLQLEAALAESCSTRSWRFLCVFHRYPLLMVDLLVCTLNPRILLYKLMLSALCKNVKLQSGC